MQKWNRYFTRKHFSPTFDLLLKWTSLVIFFLNAENFRKLYIEYTTLPGKSAKQGNNALSATHDSKSICRTKILLLSTRFKITIFRTVACTNLSAFALYYAEHSTVFENTEDFQF